MAPDHMRQGTLSAPLGTILLVQPGQKTKQHGQVDSTSGTAGIALISCLFPASRLSAYQCGAVAGASLDSYNLSSSNGPFWSRGLPLY